MQIEWTKKDVPLTQPMKDRVNERAEAIARRFPDEAFALTIALIQNKGRTKPWSYRLRGVLRHDGQVIKAESRQLDYYDGVDDMMDTLLHNVIKEKEKRIKLERDRQRTLKEEQFPVLEDAVAEEWAIEHVPA